MYFRTYSNLNQIVTLCNSYLQRRDCYLKFCLFFKLYVALMASWRRDKYDLMQRNLFEKMALQRESEFILVGVKVVFFFNSKSCS